MSDPKRLLDEGATDAELELLRAWRDEAPSPRARRALLGIAVGAGVGTATSAAAGASAAPKTASVLFAWALGKWLLVGVGSGLLALATANVVAPPDTSSPATAGMSSAANPSPRSVSSPSGATTSTDSRAGEPRTDEASRVDATPPAVPDGSAATTRAPQGRAPSAASSATPEPLASTEPRADARPRSTLADEVARVDAARALLRDGRASGALSAIDAYDGLYPAGSLAREATVLRIEALVALGRRTEAQTIARAFLASPSNAIYATRLRALLPSLANNE